MMPIAALRMRTPTTPVGGGGSDPYFANTKLLLGFEGTDGSTTFSDESSVGRTMTPFGDAQIDTAQFKFGSSSGLFDGSGDYLSTPDSADWDFGSGDFTIEFFVRHATAPSSSGYVEQYVGSGNRAWMFFREASSLRFFAYVGGSGKQLVGPTAAVVAGSWYHYCVDRASGTTRMYVNGVMVVSSTAFSGAFDNATAALTVGRGVNGAYHLNGWLDELRITKGVARYGSDGGFSVPTAAFPRN